MPTTDIIGYLWYNRQALNLDGLPDVLELVADLQRSGLECIRVEDMKVLGQRTGTTVQLVRRERAEWDRLVHDTIINASVEHTTSMFHEEGDGE